MPEIRSQANSISGGPAKFSLELAEEKSGLLTFSRHRFVRLAYYGEKEKTRQGGKNRQDMDSLVSVKSQVPDEKISREEKVWTPLELVEVRTPRRIGSIWQAKVASSRCRLQFEHRTI